MTEFINERIHDRCPLGDNCPFFHYYDYDIIDGKIRIKCRMCYEFIYIDNINLHVRSDRHYENEKIQTKKRILMLPRYLQDDDTFIYQLNPEYNLLEHFNKFHLIKY